jgi:hypothetical protein
MSLPKGKTNNPNGRPVKGKAFTEILESIAEETMMYNNTPITKNEAIAKALIDLAVSGDLKAIEMYSNRRDGTPKQSIEHSGAIGNPLLEKLDQADINNTDGADNGAPNI